jgi:hypothetical protein
LGKGEDKKIYTPLTALEMRVPILFMFLYLYLGVVATASTWAEKQDEASPKEVIRLSEEAVRPDTENERAESLLSR